MASLRWRCAAVGLASTCASSCGGRPSRRRRAADVDLHGDVNTFPVQGNVSVLIGPGGLNEHDANVTVQTSDDAVVARRQRRGDDERPIRRRHPPDFAEADPLHHQHAGGSDHTGGNEALARSGRPFGGRAAGAGFLLPDQNSGATIIAHENVLQRSQRRDAAAARCRLRRGRAETYFADEHELFNGEAIQMFHAPAALTDGDTIVFFRRSDVISTGDVFSTLTYPKIDPRAGGTIDGVIARSIRSSILRSRATSRKAARISFLDTGVSATKPTLSIPGHARHHPATACRI